MVQRKPTPEEQLLKLIENPSAPGAPSAEKPGAPAARAKAPKAGLPKFRMPDLGKMAGAFSYFKNKAALQNQGGVATATFDIKMVNRILVGLLIASLFYTVVDILFFGSKPADVLTQVGTSDPVYPVAKDAQGELKELSFYQEPVRKRNPFLAPGTVTVPVEAAPAEGSEPNAALTGMPIAEVMQGFKLVGISWGTEPLAMVEDVSTGRTYFLRRTQEIRGMKVQAISKEKVTVTYEGQEGELF